MYAVKLKSPPSGLADRDHWGHRVIVVASDLPSVSPNDWCLSVLRAELPASKIAFIFQKNIYSYWSGPSSDLLICLSVCKNRNLTWLCEVNFKKLNNKAWKVNLQTCCLYGPGQLKIPGCTGTCLSVCLSCSFLHYWSASLLYIYQVVQVPGCTGTRMYRYQDVQVTFMAATIADVLTKVTLICSKEMACL